MTVKINETELPVSTQMNLTKTRHGQAKNNIAKGVVQPPLKICKTSSYIFSQILKRWQRYRDAGEL